MSNKSRKGSTRYLTAPAEDVEPDPEEEARVERLTDALETPGRKGLEKLVGMVLDARNKPEPAKVDTGSGDGGADLVLPSAEPLREPTDYELAILHGLRDKPTYQGTVEPWRVDERRRRNRAARRTRRQQRRRAA